MATLDVIVGTWDDLSEQAEKLADRQIRVIVLPKSADGTTTKLPQEETERLLDDLTDIGMDTPSWPEECCSRDADTAEPDAD